MLSNPKTPNKVTLSHINCSYPHTTVYTLCSMCPFSNPSILRSLLSLLLQSLAGLEPALRLHLSGYDDSITRISLLGSIKVDLTLSYLILFTCCLGLSLLPIIGSLSSVIRSSVVGTVIDCVWVFEIVNKKLTVSELPVCVSLGEYADL